MEFDLVSYIFKMIIPALILGQAEEQRRGTWKDKQQGLWMTKKIQENRKQSAEEDAEEILLNESHSK